MKFCSNCGNKLKENVAFCSSCGSRIKETKGEEKTNMTTEMPKSIRVFIVVTLILIVFLIFLLLISIIADPTCQTYLLGSPCDFYQSTIITFIQIISIIIFPLSSIIMSIYIFSKRYKEQYLLAISLIILSISAAAIVLIGYESISILFYLFLFIVLLYPLLRIKR